ncbi:MAG TPA: cytochrome c oxidase subunit II [Planctomycetota bacterium]|nr:cytochrome c oxidase subunit II [Planctomycetota bacterium]
MNEFRLFPNESSTFAGRVDALFLFILGVGVFFSILIAALIVYFSIRYRRVSVNAFATPAATRTWLELTWTGIPMALTMGIYLWGSKLYFTAYRPPADALDIHVIGKQWMWKVQHPEGRREINELHVPINQPVRLVLISQDVIHDFYMPEFRIKQDVLPGRYTYAWFEANRLGESHLFCAQYCGNQHANMIGRVVVMEPAAYTAWLRGIAPDQPSMLDAGERLYAQFACNTCHGVRAPTLAGLYGSVVHFENGSSAVADESYLRDHILNPRNRTVSGFQSIMPSYKDQINEDQLVQIIAYIKSLQGAQRQPEQKP